MAQESPKSCILSQQGGGSENQPNLYCKTLLTAHKLVVQILLESKRKGERHKMRKVSWQSNRSPVLSLTSDHTLQSPAEDEGLFFETNRGFLHWAENRGIKEHSLHCGYRGSTRHSEHNPQAYILQQETLRTLT